MKDSTHLWSKFGWQVNRDGDKPAVCFWEGSKYWYQMGKRHRENAPAVVTVMVGRNGISGEYFTEMMGLP